MHTSRRGRPRPSLVLAFTLALVFSFVPALAHAARGFVGPAILGVEWFTIPETPCDGQDVRLGFTVCECQVDIQYAGLDSTNGLLHIWLNVKPDLVCVTCTPDTFIVDDGEPVLLEINPRPVPQLHLGASVGVDMGRAFADVLSGRWDGTPQVATRSRTVRLFPQNLVRQRALLGPREGTREWMRQSGAWADVPWDDFGLLRHHFREFVTGP